MEMKVILSGSDYTTQQKVAPRSKHRQQGSEYLHLQTNIFPPEGQSGSTDRLENI